MTGWLQSSPFVDGVRLTREAFLWLQSLAQAAAANTQTVITTPTWIALPTLQNGWTPDGSGTYGAPAYSIDALGIVRLRGELKAGTLTDGTLLFTLPVGARPAFQLFRPVTTFTGFIYQSCSLAIAAGGGVFIVGAPGATQDVHLGLLEFPTF